MSANRVAVILHGVFVVCTAAAAFVVAVTGSLPANWQSYAATAATALGALAAATVTVNKYLSGSQQWDALQAQQAAPAAPAHGTTVTGTFTSSGAPIQLVPKPEEPTPPAA